MIERGDLDDAARQLQLLTKLYHRAAERHVLHPNSAARKQAQFQRLLNESRAQASA
jgi:ribosomal protein S20